MRNPLRILLAAAGVSAGAALVLPIVALALPFWIVGGLVRALLAGLQPRPSHWRQLIEFEPEVGWRPRPNLDTYGTYVGGVFHLSTDADGWRGGATLDESDVVIFGDSYAFGHGMDERGYFAHRVPELRVKAIGVNGYNMVQEYLWMRRLAPRLEGKLVVWWIFCGNDLYENLCPNHAHYRMPFVRSVKACDSWEIVTDHVDPTPWIATGKRDYHARLAEICSSTALAARAYSACEFLIGRGRDLCRDAGAELIVATLPAREQVDARRREWLVSLASDPTACDPDLPDRRVRAMCDRLEVPFVALAEHLTAADYLEHDPHWNADGHRKVAYLLRRVHRTSRDPGEGDAIPIPTERKRPPAGVISLDTGT